MYVSDNTFNKLIFINKEIDIDMMIEYLSIVDYNTLETISVEKGYVSIENINELTYQKN